MTGHAAYLREGEATTGLILGDERSHEPEG
jgi:hypothetical protein